MSEAEARRNEEAWYKLAWAVAHLINIQGKSVRSRVTPRKLLGPRKPLTADQKRAEFNAVWEQAGGKVD
jgi:hypothetical protein